jgi:predicted nucleic acid-binding Zn finger protein
MIASESRIELGLRKVNARFGWCFLKEVGNERDYRLRECSCREIVRSLFQRGSNRLAEPGIGKQLANLGDRLVFAGV